jgi:hypothetical protein
MSNIQFPELKVPKITSWMFNGLKGMTVPGRSSSNTGNVGNFIDQYLKTQMGISNTTTTVDLSILGIEVKSKDIHTNSDWSIGSMTLEDILSTPYIESSIYQKLQALLLVTTDDVFQVIKDVELHYFDFDEVQQLLCDSYESARAGIQHQVNLHAAHIAKRIVAGDPNAILEKIQFKNYEKIQGQYGKFEFTNTGSSFMFRISLSQMKHLTSLSGAYHNKLFTFA